MPAGLSAQATAVALTNVRFLVEGKVVEAGAPGDDAACLAALPSMEMGFNRKHEVAWIRVRRGKAVKTFSRAALLRMPGPPKATPTPADDGATPAEPSFIGLGGTHRGQPAEVWEEALLTRICKRTEDPDILEHRIGTMRKAVGDAVERAAEECREDPNREECRIIVTKTVGGVRG